MTIFRFRTSSRMLAAMLMNTLALVPGCGGVTKDTLAVSGKVTVDGKPLDDGRITFVGLADGGSRASADVKNGEYTIPAAFGVKPGEQLVQIEAYRKSDLQVQPSGLLTAEQVAEGAVEQYLPAKYNIRSELKVEVDPGSDSYFEFDLDR